jgi:hypothetical protein
MKNIIPLLIIPFSGSFPAQAEMITVNVNRVCAAIVNIPYASDNFTDMEWQQFQDCRDYLRQFDGVK